MKLFAQGSRGISTVVGAAIMLGAVAVIGTTLVMWSNGVLTTYETNLASTSTSNINKFNEFLAIENVWFCKATCPGGFPAPRVVIMLTNGGSVGLNVNQIQLSSTSTGGNQLFSGINTAILPGQYSSWNASYATTSGVPVTIFVTTARGTIFTTQVTP